MKPEVGDLIATASYKNGYIRFSTPAGFRQGNALIAARNSSGTILWSWHIWLASEGWNEQVYYNDAGAMMDRNLGATSATPGNAGALGLMYQWGRKDPFLGSSAVDSSTQAVSTGTWSVSSENISQILAEEHPMTFYAGYTDYLPLNSWSSEKTAYDPCPAGWRVPDGGKDGVWVKASGKTDAFSVNGDSDYGWNLNGTFGADETIWYPASGCLYYDTGALLMFGSGEGYFWSVTPADGAYCLCCYGDGVYPQSYLVRSYGCAVRCVKE